MVARRRIKRQKEKQEENSREDQTAKNIDDSHEHKLNKENVTDWRVISKRCK